MAISGLPQPLVGGIETDVHLQVISVRRILPRVARRQVVGAILALLALLSAFAISGWHASIVDHLDHETTIGSMMDHHAPKQAPDLDLHQAAHVVINGWADVRSATAVPAIARVAANRWPISIASGVRTHLVDTLLRPPRF